MCRHRIDSRRRISFQSMRRRRSHQSGHSRLRRSQARSHRRAAACPTHSSRRPAPSARLRQPGLKTPVCCRLDRATDRASRVTGGCSKSWRKHRLRPRSGGSSSRRLPAGPLVRSTRPEGLADLDDLGVAPGLPSQRDARSFQDILKDITHCFGGATTKGCSDMEILAG